MTDALETAKARREVARDMSFGSVVSSIEFAALTGTDEEVLAQIQVLIDNNGLGVNRFDNPLYGRMADNAEFQKLNAILVKRANDERAKLGLEPYQRNIE
jgi:hypothetical protein